MNPIERALANLDAEISFVQRLDFDNEDERAARIAPIYKRQDELIAEYAKVVEGAAFKKVCAAEKALMEVAGAFRNPAPEDPHDAITLITTLLTKLMVALEMPVA
jgi:hypothetical protein